MKDRKTAFDRKLIEAQKFNKLVRDYHSLRFRDRGKGLSFDERLSEAQSTFKLIRDYNKALSVGGTLLEDDVDSHEVIDDRA